MAKTGVGDIIIPTEFEKYAIERTAELSRFGQSGIVESSEAFDRIAAQGGREVKMPFWKDLTATRQLLSDAASLSVNRISSDQDIARIHNDAQAWRGQTIYCHKMSCIFFGDQGQACNGFRSPPPDIFVRHLFARKTPEFPFTVQRLRQAKKSPFLSNHSSKSLTPKHALIRSATDLKRLQSPPLHVVRGVGLVGNLFFEILLG